MTRAGGLALVLVVLFSAGCGGGAKPHSGPKPLSRTAFRQAANRACAVQVMRLRRLRKPTNAASGLSYARKATAVYEQMVVAFRRLTPPPSDAPAFEALLQALDAEDSTMRRALLAVGAPQDLKAILRRGNRLAKLLTVRAAKLGLRVCAGH